MGPPRVGRTTPSNYLRRTQPLPSTVSSFKYGDEHTRKSSVTRRNDQPVYGLTTSKNFITSNAIENILTEPPKLAQPGSDQFLYRKDYGSTPNYLQKMKARHAMKLQSLQQDEYNRIREQQDKVKLLSPEERSHIVRQLKGKWDAVNNEYQKSSTLDLKKLDTMGKVRRKEQYEAELQQLESYIDRLSSKRNVFVSA